MERCPERAALAADDATATQRCSPQSGARAVGQAVDGWEFEEEYRMTEDDEGLKPYMPPLPSDVYPNLVEQLFDRSLREDSNDVLMAQAAGEIERLRMLVATYSRQLHRLSQ